MATGLTSNTSADRIFESPSSVFNEVYDPSGIPRPHWQKFLNGLRNVTVDEFARRNQQADRMLRENGVTYHLATEGGDGARPWRLDLLPMLTTAADWAVLESGLAQRANLLNLLIADIYGPRQLVADGLLPRRCSMQTPNSCDPSAIFDRVIVSRCFFMPQNSRGLRMASGG